MSIEISKVGSTSVGGAWQAKKRLIVCCDGTWNDSISSDSPLTNVSRISRLITDTDDHNVPQVVYYHTGVGSGTSPLGNVVDGISGRGISANIRNAYSFICHNFSNEEDEIVLIGFSRGAFTVQAIATLIDDVGLLTKSGLGSLGDVYKLWKIQPHGTGNRTLDSQSSLQAECERLFNAKKLRTRIEIKVCAVWDTVGSLGFPVPGPFPQKASKRLAHVNSRLRKNIEVAIQALALNERRKHFQVTVWKADHNRILKQCWFLGTHSDVGGGNIDTGLANITLVWMIAQLKAYTSMRFNLDALHDFTSKRVTKTTEQSTEFSLGVNAIPANIGVPASIGAGVSVSRSSRYETLVANVPKSKGEIRKSMRGVFVFGGSRPRKPCQYLMNEKGLDVIPKHHPVPTNETIHFTVRVLLATGLWRCGALTKYELTTENSTVKWKLLHRNKKKTAIHVPEEPFCEMERELLVNWMKAEDEKRADIKVKDSTLGDLLLPYLKLY